MQKSLIVIGLIVIAAGVLWPWLSRLPLGRLPGDIVIERDNLKVYFPIATMLLVGIVLSLLFWLFRR